MPANSTCRRHPPRPSASPSASPTPAVPRENILLIGVDQGIGRNTFLTDTMIVMSLDPVAETVSMISIPRDMVDVPLPDGRSFRGKINGLLSWARHHPKDFPGSDGTGHDVLMGALGTLLNLQIDHFAQVNLGGFVRVVDTLGGIDVDVEDGFCDPTYDEYGFSRGFAISAGRHHLNGHQALAFARVRKAAGESDFTRAARQQEVLSGIRDRVKGGGFLRDPIGLMRALGTTVVDERPARPRPAHRGRRRAGSGAARPIGRSSPTRSSGPATTSAGRSSCRTSRASGRWRRRCTRRPASSRRTSTACPSRRGRVSGSGVSSCAPRVDAATDPAPDAPAVRDRHAVAEPVRSVRRRPRRRRSPHRSRRPSRPQAECHPGPDAAAHARPDAATDPDARRDRRPGSEPAVATSPLRCDSRPATLGPWDPSSTSRRSTTPSTPTSSSAPSTATCRSR